MIVNLKERLSLTDRVSEANMQSDIIKKKKIIKDILYKDPGIIEALNNPGLDPEDPEEYLNQNIFSYLKITGVRDETRNFICFDIDDIGVSYDNSAIKEQVLIVMCMANPSDMTTNFNIDRHDLLSYLVIDDLNWSNILGMQLKLIYNVCEIIDSKYFCRTLKFKIKAANNLENGGNGRYDELQ